jgi:hypothetical protein
MRRDKHSFGVTNGSWVRLLLNEISLPRSNKGSRETQCLTNEAEKLTTRYSFQRRNIHTPASKSFINRFTRIVTSDSLQDKK